MKKNITKKLEDILRKEDSRFEEVVEKELNQKYESLKGKYEKKRLRNAKSLLIMNSFRDLKIRTNPPYEIDIMTLPPEGKEVLAIQSKKILIKNFPFQLVLKRKEIHDGVYGEIYRCQEEYFCDNKGVFMGDTHCGMGNSYSLPSFWLSDIAERYGTIENFLHLFEANIKIY